MEKHTSIIWGAGGALIAKRKATRHLSRGLHSPTEYNVALLKVYSTAAPPPIEYNVALLKVYGWGDRLIDFRISIFVLTATPICHPQRPRDWLYVAYGWEN